MLNLTMDQNLKPKVFFEGGRQNRQCVPSVLSYAKEKCILTLGQLLSLLKTELLIFTIQDLDSILIDFWIRGYFCGPSFSKASMFLSQNPWGLGGLTTIEKDLYFIIHKISDGQIKITHWYAC